MLRKNSILAVLPFILAASNAFAWSWKDAVNLAIEKNPALQAQKENAEVVGLRYDIARTYRYPELSIQGSMQNFQNETKELQYRAFAGPRLEWLLFQGGKVSSGIARASALEDQAKANVRVVSVTTNSGLRQAFAQALYAKNYLDMARRIEKQRHENVKLTEIRYQGGMEYKWAFLSSKVKWKRAQLDITRAEMNKKTALVELEKILGPLPIQSVEEISDADFYATETVYDQEQVAAKATQNPKYVVQQNRVEEGKAIIRFNKADFYPEVGLRADFSVASVENDALFPFWLTTVGFSMPLFEAGRIRKNVNLARAQLSQRTYELEQTRLNINNDLQNEYRDYTIYKQQVEINKLNVEASEDRARVVSNQYRSGLTTFLDWERSQDDWVSSEIDLLNTVKNYQVSRAKLEEAMGVELQQ